MTKTLEEKDRLQKNNVLRENGMDPYPATCTRTKKAAQALDLDDDKKATVAGRLINKRVMGRLCFCQLKDESGKIQIAFSEKELGKNKYKFFVKNFDMADFVEVSGTLFVTHKGEKSILVKKYRILSKAILPLPEKFHGLTDIEARYRQRYLDLITNSESMDIAVARSKIVQATRAFFDKKGFLEVETPVLQPLYGGALAKPFKTHHNALDMTLYLRIAPELYLKRLIVGGFEKVYEIAKCFRNEGIDHNHNPEFSQIEFYWAYANYKDLMVLMEELLPNIIKAAGLNLKFTAEGKQVDFTPPYPVITMRDLIIKYSDVDIEDYPNQASIYQKAKEMKIEKIDSKTGRGKLIDEIYKKYARPHIVDPIFMIDHPVELSPLAKQKADDNRYVERVQLLCVGGNELCNGFSELNDPIEQEERFKEQERLMSAGDDESMPYDKDFVTALKHGMPPTAGLGMGIDRLVKLLVGADSLKEVILFPTLKNDK